MADPHAAESAPDEQHAPSAEQRLVAGVLRTGLAVGLALMLAGAVVRLASGSPGSESVRLRELASPLPLASRLSALGVLALGLTPAVRVLLLLSLWLRERDWRFAAVAAIVLAVLTASLLAGVG